MYRKAKFVIAYYAQSRFGILIITGVFMLFTYTVYQYSESSYIHVNSIRNWEEWKEKLNQGQFNQMGPYAYQATKCNGTAACQYPDEKSVRIIVQAEKDAHALQMTLDFLQPDPEVNAKDFTSDVALEIWINPDSSGRVRQDVLETAVNFHWDTSMSVKRVHVHLKHVGDFGKYMYTWYSPLDSKEYALFLKEGYIVSKYFLKWINTVMEKYDTGISAYSLTSGNDVAVARGPNEGATLQGRDSDTVFLYLALPKSAIVPHPKVWHNFHDWVTRLSAVSRFRPYIPQLKETQEFQELEKQGYKDGLWSLWYMYYAQEKNRNCVYSNLRSIHGDSSKLATLVKTKHSKSYLELLDHWADSYKQFPAIPITFALDGTEVIMD